MRNIIECIGGVIVGILAVPFVILPCVIGLVFLMLVELASTVGGRRG